MRDPRNARLAQLIVEHSIRLQPEEPVLIEAFDVTEGLVLDLVEAVHGARGIPLVRLRGNAVQRRLLHGGEEAQFRLEAEIELGLMKKVPAYIADPAAGVRRRRRVVRRRADPTRRALRGAGARGPESRAPGALARVIHEPRHENVLRT